MSLPKHYASQEWIAQTSTPSWFFLTIWTLRLPLFYGHISISSSRQRASERERDDLCLSSCRVPVCRERGVGHGQQCLLHVLQRCKEQTRRRRQLPRGSFATCLRAGLSLFAVFHLITISPWYYTVTMCRQRLCLLWHP